MGEAYSGGCMCGAVRYTVEGEPEAVSICHCASCRRAVGATPVAWVVSLVESVSIAGDTLASYSSSEGVTRTFCSRCGTSLTFMIEDHDGDDSPDSVDITLGSFDRPELFTPERHIWIEDRVIQRPHGLPQYQRSSSEPRTD